MAEENLNITLRKDPALQQLLLDIQIAAGIKKELLAGLDPKDIQDLRDTALKAIINQDQLKEGEISLADFITQHIRADELIEERTFVWSEEQTKLLEFEGQTEEVREETETTLADGQKRLTAFEIQVEELDAKIEGVMAKQTLLTQFKGTLEGLEDFGEGLPPEIKDPKKIPYLFFAIRRLTQQIPALRQVVYWMGQARLAERVGGAGGTGAWVAGIIMGYNLLITAQRIIADIRRKEEQYRLMVMEHKEFASVAQFNTWQANLRRESQQQMKGYA